MLQGVIAAARDVTALKRIEQKLQQKNVELEEASRMKSANSVAHAVVEKARKTTEKAGDTVVEAGEKLTKLGERRPSPCGVTGSLRRAPTCRCGPSPARPPASSTSAVTWSFRASTTRMTTWARRRSPWPSRPCPPRPPTPRSAWSSIRCASRRVAKGTRLRTDIGMQFLDDATARRRMLDAAAPDNPVILWSWTGHDAVFNTAALRALNLADDARDPLGGEFERDSQGRLTGRRRGYAQAAALRHLYSLLPDSTILSSLRQYAAEGLKFGITSVQDMHGYLDPATTVRVLRAARLPIRLRVVPYFMTDTRGRLTAEWANVDRHPDAMTVVSGAKYVLDGSPIERMAFMRVSYADRAAWRGQLGFPEDTVRAILAEALASKTPLLLHAVGDSTPRLIFGLMQQLAPDSAWRPLRVRLEHGDGVTTDLLPVARRLGVVIVENPTHFAIGADMIGHRYGRVPPDFQAQRSLLAAGIPFALGSDGPRNPFTNVMYATTHPTNPGEAITREQAVTAYTLGSAYAEFAERDKGMLAPGMLADLAVLSKDIFMIAPADLPTTLSVLTMIGGRVVFETGVLNNPIRR